MKAMSVMLLLSLLAMPAMAGLVVTPNDVQIRFPDAVEPDSAWCVVSVENISYLAGTVGEHQPKAKINVVQIWEGLLQKDQPELGKARIEFRIISLPKIAGSNQDARHMEFRFAVRYVRPDGTMSTVEEDDFSEFNSITIQGKPGQPANQ